MSARRQPLRVVHLVGNSLPLSSFWLFARNIDGTRVALTIGSLDHEGPLQAGLRELGIPTFALGADRRSAYPLAVARFASLLRRVRADVLQTHLLEACLVGLSAGRLAGVPATIFTAHHSHEIPLHRRPMLTLADRVAAGPLCDCVIAPSQPMKETLIREYHLAPSKITVIPHGFDFAVLDPASASGASFRAQYGLNGRIVFGSVSRYFWIKNVEGLIRAFALVARGEPAATLVIVGRGDRSSAEGLVKELGLGGRVALLGPTDDVASAYAAIDVVVNPAIAESFGQVIIEAMAMSKPVVCTPVGVAPEVIDDGRTGFIAAGPHPQQLAEAMKRALAAREQWPALGSAARQRVLGFTAESWVAGHVAAYDELTAAARRRRRRL